MQECLRGAPGEAGVRGQRDRDVDVEDLLEDARFRVLGRPEDRKREPAHQKAGGRQSKAAIP